MKPLILASSSPRRKEILTLAGLTFQVLAPSCSEEGVSFCSPGQYVEDLSRIKCEAGAGLAEKTMKEALIIGADTIVYYNGKILGKPSDAEEAARMLWQLSGNSHQVFTGVTVMDLSSRRSKTFHEETTVCFYDLTEQEIQDYVATKEPLDKAGAYGIQGIGSYLVKEIHGDYFNVVGLPAARLLRVLKTI